jgi:hypothetical protein
MGIRALFALRTRGSELKDTHLGYNSVILTNCAVARALETCLVLTISHALCNKLPVHIKARLTETIRVSVTRLGVQLAAFALCTARVARHRVPLAGDTTFAERAGSKSGVITSRTVHTCRCVQPVVVGSGCTQLTRQTILTCIVPGDTHKWIDPTPMLCFRNGQN